MPGVRVHKPDLEDMIITKAEELAEQRYGREFGSLPPSRRPSRSASGK